MKIRSTHLSTMPDRNILLSLAWFILLVGGAPVAIRITYSELSPFWLGFLRYGLGAVAFWVLVLYKHLKIPKGRSLIGPVLFGILGIGVPFAFLGWGLLKTSASLASVLMAMVPLITIFLSAFQCVEVLTPRGIVGALLAITGTIITVSGATSAELSFPHILAIVVGTGFLAQGGVIVKRYPSNSPIIMNAIGVTVGAVILAIVSLMVGEPWVVPTLPGTWAALGYLIFFVTVIAFMQYLRVLNRWTASGASYGFVIIPLVTVVIAAVLTREHITRNFIMGASLVLIGIVIGALLPGKEQLAV